MIKYSGNASAAATAVARRLRPGPTGASWEQSVQ
jgi:hypothetical protein